MNHSGLESLRRNIERLIRERHLGLANRLLDRYQPTLRSGSFESEFALGLQEIQTQVASLFPPAGDADPFSDASKFNLAQEAPPPHPSFAISQSELGLGRLWLDQCFYLGRFLWRGCSPKCGNLPLHGSMKTKSLRGICGRCFGSYLAWSSFPSPPTHHPVRAAPSGQPSAVPLRPPNLPKIFYRLTALTAVRVKKVPQ